MNPLTIIAARVLQSVSLPCSQMNSGQTDFNFQKHPAPQNAGSRGEEMLPSTVLLRKNIFLSQLLLLYFHTLFDFAPEVLIAVPGTQFPGDPRVAWISLSQ